MSLEKVWQTFSNISSIIWIHLAIREILANEAFIVTDDLISQLFVVAFVHPTYIQIALIWGFTVQLSLWKLNYWLWRYKLNEVCNIIPFLGSSSIEKNYMLFGVFEDFLEAFILYSQDFSHTLIYSLLNWISSIK